ncbi:MAG: replication initiation protein [Spirochaetaceae bacterium]|nr:replication initiation protein [Spirochaetaceae bacterium]
MPKGKGRKKAESELLKDNLKDSHEVQKSKPLFSLWKSDLTLAEFKILDTYLSRINSHKPEQRDVIFEKGELEKLLGVVKINNKDLDTRLKHLQATSVNLGHDDRIDRVTLFERSQGFQDENGVWQVILTCTQSAMKYFFNIEEIGYLRYKLRSIINISSRYSYILFTYLEQNRFRMSWTVPLNELKRILDCEEDETYAEYKHFNNLILKRCYKELTEKTELQYTYEPIRRGRKVTEIKFTLASRAVIPKETQIEGQLTFSDSPDFETETIEEPDIEELMLKKYGSESLTFIAGAMDYEFTKEETRVLFDIVLEHYIEPRNDAISRYDFVLHVYNRLKQRAAATELEPLKSRYSYMKKLLEQELE